MNRFFAILLGGLLAASTAVAQGFLPISAAGASSPGAAPAITQKQRMLLDEKIALVERIMRASGAHAQSDQVSAAQQRWMLESLYALPLAELRGMAMSGSLEATIGTIARANVKAGKPGTKLGQLDDELVYLPIAPCRFIDTRITGGKVVGSRAFDLDLTGAAYGGSGGCDPKSHVGGNANVIGAVSMNVAIVDPSAQPGFLGARPFGSTNLTSMVNWYQAGPTVQASNAGIVTSNQTTIDDEIEFFGTTTHLVVDMPGFFAAPTATALECATGSLTQTVVSSGTPTFALDATTCPANYRMQSNTCRAIGDTANVRLSQHGVISLNNAICAGSYEGGSTATITNTPWCCRMPGR